MKYRKRIYYTEADKALMWDRWQKGDEIHPWPPNGYLRPTADDSRTMFSRLEIARSGRNIATQRTPVPDQLQSSPEAKREDGL